MNQSINLQLAHEVEYRQRRARATYSRRPRFGGRRHEVINRAS